MDFHVRVPVIFQLMLSTHSVWSVSNLQMYDSDGSGELDEEGFIDVLCLAGG